MTLARMRVLAMLGLALAGTWMSAGAAIAQEAAEAPAILPQYDGTAAPQGGIDVFHNFYPNTMAGVNSARLYPSPIPTPPIVGHTYYTYQPLMPHEMMYAHKRVYYTPMPAPGGYYSGINGCNTGYGYNKTTVVWQHHGLHRGLMPIGGGLKKLRGHFGHGAHCNSCGGHGCNHCR